MTDEQHPQVFDMPHARVTLTPIGPGIEIEVWPKAGQSAYAVVDPTVAILIAKRLVEMAAGQLAAAQATAAPAARDGAAEVTQLSSPAVAQAAASTELDAPGSEPPEDEETGEPARPSNVVDLASRRRPSAS